MAVDLKSFLENNTMPAAAELVRDRGEGVVQCLACGHKCRIAEGKSGICQVRVNQGGQLRVPAGYVAGLNVDPIEKKPFYHVHPGFEALSFGMLGCNFHCPFCQNWVSSQTLRDESATARPTPMESEQIVSLALKHATPVMVSTYNEPLITTDWAVEIFKRARAKGIICGYVSNGHATREVLEYIRPYVDLYKVDLKSCNEENYRQVGGKLNVVLETINNLKEMGFWVEVVTLVVPGFNDSDEDLKNIANFLASVSADIPWHVTAFHPDYKMTAPPRTPLTTLIRAYDIGRSSGLKFVYAGNLPGTVGERENTFCPSCGTLLVHRYGFLIKGNYLCDGKCPQCDAAIPGVWE